MKVFAIVNQKGGVGKTTSSLALASLLSKDHKVLLVDLDFQANATTNSGVDKKKIETKLLKNLMLEVDTPAKDFILTTEKGYDIVASNLYTANLELDLNHVINKENVLKSRLEELDRDYEYIILDCPPGINNMVMNAFLAADFVLAPLDAHKYAVEGIDMLFDIVAKIKRINRKLQYKFFITKIDRRLKADREIELEIEKAVGDLLLKTRIRTDAKIREAGDKDKTIVEVSAEKAIEDYTNLIKEIETWVSLTN